MIVDLPITHESITIPQLFIERRTYYIGKGKNKKSQLGWFPVQLGEHSINKTRNIASRGGDPVLHLKTGKTHKIESSDKIQMPRLKDFPRLEDRRLVYDYLTHLHSTEVEDFPHNKPRGRPPVLPKNWAYHDLGAEPQEYKNYKNTIKGTKKSVKKHTEADMDWGSMNGDDNEDTQSVSSLSSASTSFSSLDSFYIRDFEEQNKPVKKRGRPRKYTEEGVNPILKSNQVKRANRATLVKLEKVMSEIELGVPLYYLNKVLRKAYTDYYLNKTKLRELLESFNKKEREDNKDIIEKLEKRAYHAEGEGIIENISEAVKKGVKTVKKGIQKGVKSVEDYANVIVIGRNDYPPKVRDILSKYGNEIITGITIGRAPVPSLLTGALNAVSLGQFGKNLENSPYDTLFHLYILVKLQNGTTLLVEKNEVINMSVNPKSIKGSELKAVSPIPSNLSVNQMLEKAKSVQGGKYFKYSARDNNCQDFILAILTGNNIGNSEDKTFVKQDTKQLFNELPALRKISNTITDIGAKVNEITTGKGVKVNKTLKNTLNHLVTHITDPKEPVDNRDFKQSKEIIDTILKEKTKKKGKGLKA